MSLFATHTAFSRLHNRRARRIHVVRDERGFSLIEVLLVVSLLGVVTTMFATLNNTTVRRSSEIQAQNIAQTEVRGALNQVVSDLRNATRGTLVTPIFSYGPNSLSFYSPNRSATMELRKIKYSLSSGGILQRQVTKVTSYSSDGNPIDPGDTGTIQNVVAIQAPETGDPAARGWAQGEIFKYCVQSPPNMTIDPSNATSPELITWNCQKPTKAAEVKTILIRAVVSGSKRSTKFNYGAVATLRWNGQ